MSEICGPWRHCANKHIDNFIIDHNKYPPLIYPYFLLFLVVGLLVYFILFKKRLFEVTLGLARQAETISPRSLSHRFEPPTKSQDVEHLVASLNAMLDRLEAGHAQLRKFTWDAAHQLRTPLAVLSARLAGRTTSLDVQDVAQDLEWMSRLVGQLLVAAKTGNVEVDLKQQFDLCAIASDVVAALAPLAFFKGRNIELDCDSTEAWVAGDVALATEAISNLVENAISHAPADSMISVIVIGPNQISVADRGPGVPDAERDYIFERFAQGSKPTRGGAGLGLSIVADIMKKHQGAVHYRDREGGGALFTLTFMQTQSPISLTKRS